MSTTSIAAKPRVNILTDRIPLIVLSILAATSVLFGVGDINEGGATFGAGEHVLFQSISGTTWEQAVGTSPQTAQMIDHMVRQGGLHLAMVGALTLVILFTGFRGGERWAWYAMWLWVVLLAINPILIFRDLKYGGSDLPVPVVSGSISLVVILLMLALSYRKFFPKG
jgi:TRAP-type mannitol/chloroaromatic compound transport system permease large subunit